MNCITYEQDGGFAVVTLNRPDQRNAIDSRMAGELRAAMLKAEAEPSVRVVILTGTGSVFCAGMDLGAFAAGERPGLKEPEGFAYFVGAVRTKPVIAAINGPALAGGFEIVLSCDFAIAAETAKFGLPEVKRGIIAAGGGIFRLASQLPPVVANKMVLTGDIMSASEALQYGLVNSVVEEAEVLAAAKSLARKILENAPLAVTTSLALLKAERRQEEKALWFENGRAWAVVDGSQDALEGARAFKEKRPPRWSGS